jgi:hypothetical protein
MGARSSSAALPVGSINTKIALFLSRALMPAVVAAASSLSPIADAQTPVLQRGYDANVSGATLTETTLNTSNVGPNTFGLRFMLPLDDYVMAQPLYVPDVAIPNQGTHNVLYVATMSDSLYAFDADVGGAPLWHINVASLVNATPVPIAKFVFSSNRNIIGNLGILSTPVIDPSTNILYLVACTLENGTMAYRLHAINITDGVEPYGPGVLISGSYGGSTFEARYQTQRVSLALSGNQVVFGFGAVELEYAGGYVGWVMAYDKQTLAQSGVFATVTTGNRGGGVWQSGRPPVIDSSGYAYVYTGNAYGGGYDGVNNFSESALKLNPAGGLALIDWFTPGNWSTLDANDLDLTSSGPMLIPGTALLAGGGKNGELYLLNTADLGKYNANDSQVVQKEQIAVSEIRGGPVYWQRPTANGGPVLYNWGVNDRLKAYSFNGSTVAASPSSQGNATQIFPGGILALSANGGQPGTGVIWATVATSGDAENNPPVPGALYAFDADNVATELWSSTTNAARDSFGNFAKFVPPLVANGKVYVATWSNQLAVYGLLGATTVSLAAADNIDGIFTDGKTVSSTGLDGHGYAYSGNALGSALTWDGVPFTLGAPDTLNAASNQTISLPSGNFANLLLLATAVDGNKSAQAFKVTYSDGTSATTNFNLSDWCTPQNYSGETRVKIMTVRDTNRGKTVHDCASVNLYGYSMALNVAKTVQSLTLPASGQVVTLAVTLVQ